MNRACGAHDGRIPYAEGPNAVTGEDTRSGDLLFDLGEDATELSLRHRDVSFVFEHAHSTPFIVIANDADEGGDSTCRSVGHRGDSFVE